MSPELELFNQLEGGPFPYLTVERHVFDGHRLRCLGSIRQMRRAGLISVRQGGALVPDWQLATWLRAPDDRATSPALETVELDITDPGVAFLEGADAGGSN